MAVWEMFYRGFTVVCRSPEEEIAFCNDAEADGLEPDSSIRRYVNELLRGDVEHSDFADMPYPIGYCAGVQSENCFDTTHPAEGTPYFDLLERLGNNRCNLAVVEDLL